MTTTAIEQGHAPGGVQGAGQWLEKPASPPEVDLNTATNEGSFLYPNADWKNADEYINYWDGVHIGDRVLSNLDYMYKEQREDSIGDALDAWSRERARDPEVNRWIRKHTREEVDAAHNAALAEERERLQVEEWPVRRIHPLYIRNIALAGQMYRFRKALPVEERGQVEQYKLNFGDATMEVVDIWDRYHLDEIVDEAFVDQDVSVSRNIRKLQATMADAQL